jgi:pentatricopeptide repeat protein
MKNTALIDTNLIIRLLVADGEFEKAVKIFEEIEKAELFVEIKPCVIVEAYFVLTKFYKFDKSNVIEDLKKIISLDGVINNDKIIILEALSIMEYKSIDFVDALLCAEGKLKNKEVITFDKDIKKCLN